MVVTTCLSDCACTRASACDTHDHRALQHLQLMSHTVMSAAPSHVVPIAIHGAKGRMGMRIAACAEDDPGVRVVAAVDRSDETGPERQPSVASMLAKARVIIDFSSDEGTREAVKHARTHGAGLIVGTTALSPITLQALAEAEREIALMVCSNTSLGVAVTRRLAAEAARLLGPGYDVDVVEAHHTKKLDTPSGTALSLVASLREGGREVTRDHVHAIRAGDVIGDHMVQFAGAGEIIRIQHIATTRDLFARGAIRAARWLFGKSAGRYRIEDTFGD